MFSEGRIRGLYMGKDYLILVVAWMLTIIMLLLFIPKRRIREAQLVFLFKLSVTWLVGLIVVEDSVHSNICLP